MSTLMSSPAALRGAAVMVFALVTLAGSPAAAEPQATTCPAGRDASCVCWIEHGITRMSCKTDVATARNTPGTRPVAHAAVASSPRQGQTAAELAAPSHLMTDEERRSYFQKRQDKLDEEVLAAQRARFLARASGKSDEQVEQLNRNFRDLQKQNRANLIQLRALGQAD